MNAQQPGWYPDPDDASQWRYWSGTAWTAHRSPGSPAPGPPPPTGAWYFVITLASCGLLAAVPFFHAASRLDRPSLRKIGAGMAAATLVAFLLIGLSPEDDTGSATGVLASLGAVIMVGVMLVATLLLIGLRRDVYQSGTPRPHDANQSARAGVEAARRKRNEARDLAARDPMMARELGIGRLATGTTKQFDDGGLLELNFATAEELAAVCGLPPNMAEIVVASRVTLGRFQHVEDAIVFGQVSEEYAPMIRDRGIVIADH